MLRVLAFGAVCSCITVFAEESKGIKYKVRIVGAHDSAVKKAIKESTATWKLQRRRPSTLGQLQRRMETDLSSIEAIMESRGYYDGSAMSSLETDRKKVVAEFRIELGEQYRFRVVDIRYLGDPDKALLKIKPLLRSRQHAVAASVFAEQKRLLNLMKQRGYPFPRLVKRTVEVDRENRVVDLWLEFDPGKLAYFGELNVEGLTTLEPKYIRRQLPWNPGEKYNEKEVQNFQKRLLSSGLFGTASVKPLEPAAGTNTIRVAIGVSERDKRTIRLGVNYSDIGPGGKIFWEHRSLFGGGERLETALSWNPVKWGGEGTFTRTGFLDARQSLVLSADAAVETPDAYDARRARGTALVLRDFTSAIQGGIGGGYKYSLVEQFDEKERYGHVFFPVQARFDNRNDALNPVRGTQVFGRTAHYEGTREAHSFLKSELEGRQYFMLWDTYRLSSAIRVTMGSIDGGPIGSVPADERFYAGGGGSIRGYEYQAVGPRFDGTPTGGSKLLEFSAELRLQPGRRLGYALFVDGGTVYNDLLAGDEDRSLSYGAGAGLRWFTTIGPLRADLAYPLNPSPDQVERLQFYISLGQAF